MGMGSHKTFKILAKQFTNQQARLENTADGRATYIMVVLMAVNIVIMTTALWQRR